MRRIRSALTLSGVVIAVAFGLSLPGNATVPQDETFQTIVADLNGDGIPDRATLGQVGDLLSHTCSVTVQYGKPDGTFTPPVVHIYTTLETMGPFCPSIGVADKLGDHRLPDLVTAFPNGYRDVMVLTRFRPVAIYSGVVQPDALYTADLAGQGRQDIIELSGQESELGTLTNTEQGTLVRGPIDVCAHRPEWQLADFTGRGGDDILVAGLCGRASAQFGSYVTVAFGNGRTPVVLAADHTGTTAYTAFIIDLDHNGIPDVGIIATAPNGTVSVSYFRNDGHGNFTPTSGP